MDLRALRNTLVNPPTLEPFLSFARYEELGAWPYRSRFELGFSVAESFGLLVGLESYQRRYGYVLATSELMQCLVELLEPYGRTLDAGCGSGFLSAELGRLGARVWAVDHCDHNVADDPNRMFAIERAVRLDQRVDAVDLLPGDFGAVMLTWPPIKHPFAARVARAMRPGQILVYEGEGPGGATADAEFFDLLADATRWEEISDASARLNEVHVCIPYLNDCWRVWRRLEAL